MEECLYQIAEKIYQINQQWGEFVAGYHRLAKDDAERAVTERMLAMYKKKERH